MLIATATLCMALNIFHESRGETLAGQHAVAQVTMNRAKRDPKNVCKVVFEPRQFSWANGLAHKGGAIKLPKRLTPSEGDPAWKLAKSVALTAVLGFVPDITKGATYYHTVGSRPAWRRSMRFTYTVGRHKFYASA